MNLGFPAITDSELGKPKKVSQLPIFEVWILSELRTIYRTSKMRRKMFVLLLNWISVGLRESGFAKTGAGTVWVSEDLSGTGLLTFLFILCFFDILP